MMRGNKNRDKKKRIAGQGWEDKNNKKSKHLNFEETDSPSENHEPFEIQQSLDNDESQRVKKWIIDRESDKKPTEEYTGTPASIPNSISKMNFNQLSEVSYRRSQSSHPSTDVIKDKEKNKTNRKSTKEKRKETNETRFKNLEKIAPFASRSFKDIEKGQLTQAQWGRLYNIGGFNTFPNHITKSINIETKKSKWENRALFNKKLAEKRTHLKVLTDRILEHKNRYVRALLNKLSGKESLKAIVVDENQRGVEYPCLIMRLNDSDDFEHHKTMKERKAIDEYDKSYPEFLTHLLIAHINYELYKANIGCYLDRRSSFGFLTPSATDVGSGIRLSLGLVPSDDWIDCVVQGIESFDTKVKDLWENKIITQGETKDNGQEGHGQPHSLFRNGKIKNFGHQLMFDALIENPQTLDDLLKNIRIQHKNINDTANDKCKSLSESLKNRQYKKNSEMYKNNNEFEKLYNAIFSFYDVLLKKNETLQECIHNESAHNLLNNLEENINEYRIKSLEKLGQFDAITETSDFLTEETDVDASGGKYDSPTGMSSLFAPLVAFHKTYNPQSTTFYETQPNAYFELPGWGSGILSGTPLKKASKHNSAQVVYIDNNPCLVGDMELIKTTDYIDSIKADSQIKMLVVDVTSSTSQQRKKIRETWKKSPIHFLVFATSGLKNQQVGLDNAQYGENKLYVNNNVAAKKSSALKERLKKLTQRTSSPYATLVKREMSTAAYELRLKDYLETISETCNQEIDSKNSIAPEKVATTEPMDVDQAHSDGINRFSH